MKITDMRTFAVAQFVYVKIETDSGLYGLGEASLSGRSLAVVEALQAIKPSLVGQDATRIEFIWQDIFRGTFWRGGPVLQGASWNRHCPVGSGRKGTRRANLSTLGRCRARARASLSPRAL